METLETAGLLHTQEVRGSSPCAPTIVFSNLHSTISNNSGPAAFPAGCRWHRSSEIVVTGYALDSGSPYRLWFGTDRRGGLGDVGVGRWACIHSLLDETEEQHSAAPGFSPVKAKREHVEVVRQMFVRHCALVRTG